MKFKEYEYIRPDYDKVKQDIGELIEAFKKASSAEQQLEVLDSLNTLRNNVETMQTIASIRYSIDTNNEFYTQEDDYWNEYGPLYAELTDHIYKAIDTSSYKQEIAKALGDQYMNIVAYSLKSFSPEIIEDLQVENKLTTAYDKLIASAKIPFQGKELNLSGLRPFMVSKERGIRKEAHEAYFGFFEKNESEFDRIYDELVKVRDKMAKKLGYKNFVELGYIRMNRIDYNAQMVEAFRKQVKEYIVPAASKLYERQAKRLGLEKLSYFDIDFEFETGNATPKGDANYILEAGKKMYEELSPETKEFFAFMTEHELMDLETKEGKQAGGYCTYMSNYSSPFIFSNFNGTSDDVDVLTHEAGHAFQVYRSRWIEQPEVTWPTYESAEIHSMSMEFITWPWMESFFKEETDKYKFIHLGSAIKFIPYGITVDAFQHFVYENPNATIEERKAAWREIEKTYLPHKEYKECPLLEKGTWWYKQGHIFSMPFYYIDYTLAQICALQFWKKSREDQKKAWEDYLRLCDLGGTKAFLGLVAEANLISPFEEGCVASVISEIDAYLESIDDRKL
jgi:M3 family oligoendopeptidase